MKNPTCQRIRRGQDCASRNALKLCDACTDLLSPDERREREADRWVIQIKKHADYYMRELKTRCLRPGTWRRYSVPASKGKCISLKFTRHQGGTVHPEPKHFTCAQMKQRKICPGCVNSMNDEQLRRYWLDIITREAEQEEQRQNDLWMQARAEAHGWPFADPETLETPAALAFGIFMVSAPCFKHGPECAL